MSEMFGGEYSLWGVQAIKITGYGGKKSSQCFIKGKDHLFCNEF